VLVSVNRAEVRFLVKTEISQDCLCLGKQGEDLRWVHMYELFFSILFTDGFSHLEESAYVFSLTTSFIAENCP